MCSVGCSHNANTQFINNTNLGLSMTGWTNFHYDLYKDL